ncbi:hypothetical protein [Candidatus Magnetominusculus dajiuhuensis]|uniref:hypothetical protein n=1 Tax=Candidatus Magnetominusculus dajiuhuensis TaxID=3137712 RepID=UPI003B439402
MQYKTNRYVELVLVFFMTVVALIIFTDSVFAETLKDLERIIRTEEEQRGQISSLIKTVEEQKGQIDSLIKTVEEQKGQIDSLIKMVEEQKGQINKVAEFINIINIEMKLTNKLKDNDAKKKVNRKVKKTNT